MSSRIKVLMILSPYQEVRIDQIRGQADLVYRNGAFSLYATLGVPEGDPIEFDGFLGVDLWIATITVDSDGTVYSGAAVTNIRKRHGALQRARTRSAKRLSGQDVNHWYTAFPRCKPFRST